MTIVVRVEWHFLSECLNVAEQLEVWVACFSLISQFCCFLQTWLRDFMNLEDTRAVIEYAADKSI